MEKKVARKSTLKKSQWSKLKCKRKKLLARKRKPTFIPEVASLRVRDQ
jgi:hypothetical protein